MLQPRYEPGWIDNEVQTFQKRVRRFIENDLVPQQERWREQRGADPEAWIAAGESGILLPDVPREYGGGGGSFAHEAIVLEELARAGVHFGSSIQSIVAHYILTYGSEEQKTKWLPPMARGEIVAAIAMTEPNAGSDLQGIATEARRAGMCYVISGSKTFITNARLAGIVCLATKTDRRAAGAKGISLIVVETNNLAGYRVGQPIEKVGRRQQDTCELFFDGVSVPASNLLGCAEGSGFAQIMEQMPYERLSIAVSAVATAEQAVAITTAYVKQRKVFGKPLMDFQNTRFKLAECKTEAQIGRVFLDDCIERFIAGRLDDITTAMAKYWLTECQCRIVDECVQLHGGYGYASEHQIARMWVDGRVQRIYAGANEIMKELIAISL